MGRIMNDLKHLSEHYGRGFNPFQLTMRTIVYIRENPELLNIPKYKSIYGDCVDFQVDILSTAEDSEQERQKARAQVESYIDFCLAHGLFDALTREDLDDLVRLGNYCQPVS